MLTEDQKKKRLQGLGGSDALAYCGKDPNCTPLQLYLEKTGESAKEKEMDMRQEFGHRIEPVMRDWLAEKIKQPIIVPTDTFVSDEFPFMLANLDGITQGGDITELKTMDKFIANDNIGEDGTDIVPMKWILQVTHYMVVKKCKLAHIGALIGGNDARHYIIEYDDALANMLVDNAKSFWQRIIERNPPDAVTIEDCKKRWQAIEGKSIIANPEVILAINEYKELKEQYSLLEEKLKEHELQIKKYMADSVILTDAKEKPLITWKEHTRTDFDTKRLKENHPALAKEFERISKYRTFRVK